MKRLWILAVLVGAFMLAPAQGESARARATRLYQQRDFTGAAAALREHLGAHPSDHSARLLLGLALQLSGDVPSAEEAFRAAVQEQPKDPNAWLYHARTLFLLGRFEEAGAELGQAEKRGAPKARVLNLRGLIFEERGDLEAALQAFRQAIASDPPVAFESRLAAGRVLLKLDNPVEAANLLAHAVHDNPGSGEAYYHLGRAHLALGKPDQARQDLERAVALGGPAIALNLLDRVRSGAWKRASGPEPVAGEAPPIRFENALPDSRIDFVLENSPTPRKHLIETMTGGLAAFDYDKDGLIDLFFVNGAELPSQRKTGPKYWNRLYRNRGGMRFEDVTETAGVKGEGFSMGAAAGDYDNDGHPDLFVAGVGRNLLYHNQGNGTFADVTAQAGIASDGWAVAGGWLDYDRDGLLDLFIVRYLDWSIEDDRYCGDQAANLRVYCHPKHYRGLTNRLYRNLGGGRFQDVSDASGIGRHPGKGMSAAFADYDRDGWIDIFVTNDTTPNFLFRNKGDGTFEEAAMTAGVALNDDGRTVSAMGADFQDADNDGWPDLIFTALTGETFPFFRNLGGGLFQDATYASGIGRSASRRSGWGVAFADFNNDGWLDLITANSHVTDNIEKFASDRYRQPNLLLAGIGGGRFTDVTAQAGEGFAEPRAHRGLVVADFDNDGRLDLAVSCLGGPPELWHNISPSAGAWAALDLRGIRSNRDAIGAAIEAGKRSITRTSTAGYASSALAPVHIALPPKPVPIRIRWPSGTVQTIGPIEPGQVTRITEPAAPSK